MSKNMTRKGLAFAAITALATSVLSGIPANAAGISNGTVSLSPNTGSNYAVLLGQNFALKANSASSVTGSGKYLKFLVEDSVAAVTVVDGQYVGVPTAAAGTGSTDTIAITIANHSFKQGDKVSLTGVTYESTGTSSASAGGDGGVSAKETATITIAGTFAVGDVITVANAAAGAVTYEVTTADVSTGTTINNIATGLLAALEGATGAIYEEDTDTGAAVVDLVALANGSQTAITAAITRVNLAALTDVAISAVATGGSGTITVPSAAAISGNIASGGAYASAKATISTSGNRSANNSYVVDTKVDSNTANKVLTLTTASATAKSATVTAWIDDNGDNKIDTTEVQSPARTVQFVALTGLTPTVTLSPATTGDTSLTATMSTTPALNGEQVGDDKVGAVFTRQDSSVEVSKLATYNVDTELWEVAISLDDGSLSPARLYGTSTTGDWGFTNPTGRSGGADAATDPIQDISVSTTGVVTVTTVANHDLRAGDEIEMTVNSSDSTVEIAEETTAVAVTVTGLKTFTYAVSETTMPSAALNDTQLVAGTAYTVETYSGNHGMVTRAFPGTHSARFAAMPKTDIDASRTDAEYLDKVGTAVSSGAAARTASSLSVDAVEGATAGKTGADTTDVLNGTTTASVTVSVLTSTGAVAAGVAVKGAVNGAPTGSGDFTLNGAVAVSGSASYVTTNALGQATFTVTNSVAAINDALALQFTTEGLTAVSETLTWNDAQYRIYDLNDMSTQSAGLRDRFAVTGGTYSFDLLVADQYRNPAPAAFGLLAAVTDRAVATGYVELSAGRATYTVTDGGLGSGAFATVDLQIVKKVGASWTTPTDADVINWDQAYSAGLTSLVADEQRKVRVNFATQTDKITVNANGASSPNTATAADLAATVATKALTEADIRLVSSSAPSYAAANKGVISGSVANSVTGAANKGTVVTLTLPGILFNAGDVWKLNSISLLTDVSGFFAVDVYTGTSGSKKVAITSGNATAASATVVYTGIAGDAVLTVTTPGAVKPASTFQVKATLADSFGNPLDTAAGIMKVTYTGAGIVFGTLPTQTDANGELMFSVLLGSNDTGTVSVIVSYDQNADGDFTDAKDLNVSSTTEINATGVASSAAKVNAGSFKGYVALYAKGYAGQRMSAKVGKDWVVVPVLASNFERVVEFTGAGVDVAVRIYIDRVLMDTINLTTK